MASERRERTRGDSLADQLRDAQGRIEALSRRLHPVGGSCCCGGGGGGCEIAVGPLQSRFGGWSNGKLVALKGVCHERERWSGLARAD
eukprot:1851464-Rhodomonas_salina.4